MLSGDAGGVGSDLTARRWKFREGYVNSGRQNNDTKSITCKLGLWSCGLSRFKLSCCIQLRELFKMSLIINTKNICCFDGLPNLKESVLTYNLELLNLDHRLSESCREHWCAQRCFLKPGCLFPVWCNQRSSCLCGLLPVLSWFHVSCKKENPNLI